jgi:ATP-binding cassette subfamily C protein
LKDPRETALPADALPSSLSSRMLRRAALKRLASVIPWPRSLAILGCLVFAGIAEGVGVASLLPLVTLVGDQGAPQKGAALAVFEFLKTHGIEPSVGLFVSVLVVGMLLKAALSLLALYQVGRAVAEVAVRMRLDLIDALLAARWSYYVRQPVGRFSAALGPEATQAGEAYNQTAQLIADAIQVATYLVIVLLFSWELALLSIGVGLIMVLTLNRFVTIAKRTARNQNRIVKRMLGGITDLIVGIKPMKAMGRHGRYQSLFERDAQKIRKAQRKQSFARHANKTLQEPILAACLAAGLYAALAVWQAPPGELMIMSVLLVRTVMTIGKAQQSFQTARIAETGLIGVTETIELAKHARESLQAGAQPSFERDIVFKDVRFAYDEVPVIDGVSFEVRRGQVTTLTGSSGAGKTTTVDLLLGLHRPNDGQILIDGAPLETLDITAWRRMTGYVPQELLLFHDTLRANITLGQVEFTDDDVRRALEQAGAADFVAALPEGVDTIVGERGARLSGGQRQRISIARAMIHRPRVLVLDEATTALDPETERAIVENVVELTRSTGLTVVAISHQPAWAKASDAVIHLANGEVSKIDRRDEHVAPEPALGPAA